MLFNSYIFVLLFLPLTLLFYYLLNQYVRHEAALIELILASFIFYGYQNLKYVSVLAASILINWFVSRLLLQGKNRVHKCILLILGLGFDIGCIFYFKYYDFFVENLNHIANTDFVLKNIALPLGISFFTFQQISYLIDSFRGETREYRFIEYAAFVAFFPQLVAGPIVLHGEIIPQFRDEKKWRFSHDGLAEGIYIFAVGLFKKVLIADTFGKAVSWGFTNVETMSSLEIIIVMLSYTFQIYFDFSGYCDMAIGIGKMFQIQLPINFNSPYKSLSILEFWERWHMTLNRFLKTYIYIPLGGSRKGKVRTYLNVLLVFLVSGIWHGANWTFILWGMIHGVANVLNRIFRKTWDKCNAVFQWICTFIFINVTWLIFRADSIGQAVDLLKRAVVAESYTISNGLKECFKLSEIAFVVDRIPPLAGVVSHISCFYVWVALAVALFICLNLKNLHEEQFKPTKTKALATVVFLIWSIMSFSEVSAFLYFNF